MKKISVLLLVFVVSLITGCSGKVNEVSNATKPNYKNNILVVHSNPSDTSSYVKIFNKNLDNIKTQKINEITLCTGFQGHSYDNDNLYLDVYFKKIFGVRAYVDYLVALNRRDLSYEKITIKSTSVVDSFVFDGDTVYESENAHGYANLYKHNKDDLEKDKKEFKLKLSLMDRLFLNGDDLYALYTTWDEKHSKNKDTDKTVDRIGILQLDKHSLKVKDKIEFDNKFTSVVPRAFYRNKNKIYLGLETDDSYKRDSYVLEFDLNTHKYNTYKVAIGESIQQIIGVGNDLYAVTTDAKSKSNCSIYKATKNLKDGFKLVKRFNFSVENCTCLDNHLYLLSYDKIYKFNSNLDIEKEVKIPAEYNTLIFSN